MHMSPSASRIYSRLEHHSDAVIHVLGILFALCATSWLLTHVSGETVAVSVTVYCVGLLGMICASAAYNLVPHHRPSKRVLRRIDHAAIFVMIAATYTPFAVNRLGYVSGELILAAIWACAAFGVVMKVFFPHRFERGALAVYIAMGWMVVTVLKPLFAALAVADFWLLIAGGLVYSAGIVFYVIERMPFHKTIWHGFVLVAAILHFSAIAAEFAM